MTRQKNDCTSAQHSSYKVLDMKVRLVDDDKLEGLLAHGVEDGSKSLWVMDKELGERNTTCASRHDRFVE